VQWGRDGRTLYYKESEGAGRSSIWSVPAAGGTPRLLVRFDDPERPSIRPEFATDGRRFYFTLSERQSDVWTMELHKGRARRR
jgi:Tol biopolymer transport system component